MQMFDTYVLTTLRLHNAGNVISTNIRVTFDIIHDAEAHRDADVANDFETFSVAADWREEQ